MRDLLLKEIKDDKEEDKVVGGFFEFKEYEIYFIFWV